ncbi:arginine deiminase [Peptoanaerobacter stomatis]|uniref:Arginine deiminase n=1 Tax=Peptoanaerobacter stomatis TaxID=796937 RepID=J6HAL8_9FIRM|nr:arginine deiminase [Peptoanaerobacter stomatis]EJU19908.1 arginine deiminase [Peptoanaerobacter stomatis]NWO26085.1 arginine deiminase [Peptostreptococcaceae bacterium oral taxon 081]
MSNTINVFSEIGKLNSIILHRPNMELENIVPSLREELLFDEVPYLKSAQKEHDEFADILRQNGVDVKYIEDLAAESITDEEIRKDLIENFIGEANIRGLKELELVRELLSSIKDNGTLIHKMIEGIRKDELALEKVNSLQEMVSAQDIFTTYPMPNLYFTRDTFALIGKGVCMNHMWSQVRQRETLFGDLVFKHHPYFKDDKPSFWYNRDEKFTLEGGDIIVLSEKVIAVGISQRTEPRAIENFAKNILSSDEGFETILCLVLPRERTCMHLDTVFTMVDRDLFTVFPGIESSLEIYELKYKNGEIKTTLLNKELVQVLEEKLGVKGIQLIKQGNRGILDAVREQWSDGYNTLAIAPREVIVYERNVVINELLDKAGVKLHILKEGELSRGRGGPRCMSMPMNRDKVIW